MTDTVTVRFDLKKGKQTFKYAVSYRTNLDWHSEAIILKKHALKRITELKRYSAVRNIELDISGDTVASWGREMTPGLGYGPWIKTVHRETPGI